MKKIWPLLLVLLVLTGCSLAPDEYLVITPHEGTQVRTEATDAVPVQNYDQLKRAILGFVEAGQAEGIIRAVNYTGSVEEDLTAAAYEVAKLEPLGAYAVDYMSHDCTLIVNYYEIHIRINFRRTPREIASVENIGTQIQLQKRLEKAVDDLEQTLVLRISGYREPDIVGIVERYCADHPDTVMQTPEVSFSSYPDSGSVRITEIRLNYTEKPEILRSMATEVAESINNAAEYIRYRNTDRDKTELLFTYLTERFTYSQAVTGTPVFDALCSGIADPAGLATAWQLICDRAGVSCWTVEGLKQGEPYVWNIVSHDGLYRHVDLARSVLEDGYLHLMTDGEMTEYYWNTEQVPACVPAPEPTPQPPAQEPAEDTPAEETPAEEQPAEDAPAEDAPSEEPPQAEPDQSPDTGTPDEQANEETTGGQP